MDATKNETRWGPTRGFLLILSVGMIAWGLLTGNPYTDTFTSSNIYMHMALIAPEEVWAGSFLAGGLLMLYGVAKRSVDVMGLGSIVGFLLWTMLSTSYALTNVALTPIVTTGTMALLHVWGWWSVKRNPGTMTNSRIWNDEEVQLMADLLEIRGKKKP